MYIFVFYNISRPKFASSVSINFDSFFEQIFFYIPASSCPLLMEVRIFRALNHDIRRRSVKMTSSFIKACCTLPSQP